MLLTTPPSAGWAQRIFYRTQDWLATSPETQMRLLNGTHQASEEVRQAVQAYAAANPQEIFANFGDLAARALSQPCHALQAK